MEHIFAFFLSSSMGVNVGHILRRELTGRKLAFNLFFYGTHIGLFAYGWWVRDLLSAADASPQNLLGSRVRADDSSETFLCNRNKTLTSDLLCSTPSSSQSGSREVPDWSLATMAA